MWLEKKVQLGARSQQHFEESAVTRHRHSRALAQTSQTFHLAEKWLAGPWTVGSYSLCFGDKEEA